MSSPTDKRMLKFMGLVCVGLPLAFSASIYVIVYLIVKFAWGEEGGPKESLKVATITYGAMAGFLSFVMMLADFSAKAKHPKEERLSEIFKRWIWICAVNAVVLYVLIELLRH